MTAPRGRYAPSPTGRLHLGNIRTALLAWAHTRKAGGAFVLRIEDNDPGRARREFEVELLADLRWLGLDWDEGPDVGGPHGPYRQSEREALYAAALARLDTYPCTCTRAELRAATRTPDGEILYPGTCRDSAAIPGRAAAIRWRVPVGTIAVDDVLAGPIVEDVARETGDFVLRRRDGAWAYQLAVVVDDAAMAIDEVVRGADLLGNTPRQALLQQALALPRPRYLHVPLVLGDDGEKLSKRHRAPDLGALREAGVSPRRVIAALAASVGLVPRACRELDARALVDVYAPSRLVGGRVDLEALR